ncbi:inovirus-type Gp2 protein [Methylobacter sp.]|uniref:YagK/YfjJ domain-containing protein n=1 Tax=Methylobacter sp. TaxID=2051955 RepID=UPI001225F9DA|nr:inovirus-type Gp2 protein [Methylobacter sp.]TAK64617.1 MAG: inovirus Gp2 family protein [Methylobacter sp.]
MIDEEKIIDAFKENTYGYYGDYFLRTDEYDRAGDIIKLEKLVKIISNSTGELFDAKVCRGNGPYIECKNNSILTLLMYYINSGCTDLITETFPIHTLNPYTGLYIKLENELREKVGPLNMGKIGNNLCWFSESYDLEELANILNVFVDKIRNEVNGKEFKNAIYKHKRLVNKNTKSLINYIAYLFFLHPRLLVGRLDCRYKKDIMGGAMLTKDDILEMYVQVKKDRKDFFHNWSRNDLFEGMVGYVWKLEYTHLTGFHYHMLLFFDGSMDKQDIDRIEMLGEFWVNDITDGKGLYFNCNAKKADYKFLGIGMISHHQLEKIENLQRVASYLTKTDYYANAIVPQNGRSFGKCEILTKKIEQAEAEKRGRPRKSTLANLSNNKRIAA